MKKSNTIKLIVFVILILVFVYLSIFGLTINDKIYVSSAKNINTGLDISGGVSITYQVLNEGQDVSLEELEKTEAVMRKRLESVNIFDYFLRIDDSLDRVYVEIPTNTENQEGDPAKAVEGLDKTAKIEFRSEDGEVKLSGDDIKKATYSNTPVDNTAIPSPHVVLEFSEEGTIKFTEATTELVGKTMPITLDGEVITEPYVSDPIQSNTAIITMGQGTYEEREILAKEYAMLIDSGTLPFDLEVINKEYIGAYVGQKALDVSVKAGIIAFILISLIVIFIYRLPGLVAILSLATYTALLLFVMSATGISLTLPGIAGIILSVGMAVDANVIIFERLKEELKPNVSYKKAFNKSFKTAMATIIDGNTTTFIVAMLLYIFGIGPVKGFGIVLAIGVLLSLLTSIVITKLLLTQILPLSVKVPFLFNIKKEEVK